MASGPRFNISGWGPPTTSSLKWSLEYDKATKCLVTDRGALLAFYDIRPSIGNNYARPTSLKGGL